jgi:amidophosphoribosyltransferase
LGYISLGGLIQATGLGANQLCAACFTGDYPIHVQPESRELGKYLLEAPDQETPAAGGSKPAPAGGDALEQAR